MENAMTKNYKLMENPAGTVRESLDNVRDCVKDLYELDEDNYQAIKTLQNVLDKSNKRLDSLTGVVRRTCGRVGIGFLAAGLLTYGGIKLIREINIRLNRLEAWYELEKSEETEESDG